MMEGIELARILAGRNHSPVVYFLRIGDRVKIGTTTNLAQRMQTFSFSVQDVAMLVPGGRETERAFHQRWANLRVRNGEWFYVRGSLAGFLRRAKVQRAPLPRPAEPSPLPDGPPAAVTLAQASNDRGHAIVNLSWVALRAAIHRDPCRPASVGRSGQALLYLPADLKRWEANRPSAYAKAGAPT